MRKELLSNNKQMDAVESWFDEKGLLSSVCAFGFGAQGIQS